MSVCLDTGIVLGQTVSTTCSSPAKSIESVVSKPPTTFVNVNSSLPSEPKPELQPVTSTKSIAKLVVTTQHAAPNSNNCSQVLQKVVNPPLITVLNSAGPLTVVKSLCVTSVVSSSPHYTLVNSTPLNVTNTLGKAPTITVLNCGALTAPVTVVKAITTQPTVVEKPADGSNTPNIPNNVTVSNNICITNNNSTPPVAPAVLENRGHNVFVKNTIPDSTVPDNMPQSHKLLTANNFPATNVLPGVNSTQKPNTINGQRNKLKVLSNIVLPGPSQPTPTGNPIINKNPTQQPRYTVPPRQKLVGANGSSPKYLNKQPPNNVLKANLGASVKPATEKPHARAAFPTQKNQIKTIPPNNYLQKPQQGIKTLSPQMKNIPGQIQRTGTGLRTIPPQRPHKLPNKTNYIGKHAVQAQKMRQGHGKMKNLKMPPRNTYTGYMPPMPDKQLTFNQALTAQIIETLSNTSTPMPSNRYEILPSRYDSAFTCPDVKQPVELSMTPSDEKAKSGLDALSLICQAVLLDHNYNATLPSESPTRPSPPINSQAQVNGMTANSLYSPPPVKRRSLSTSNTVSTSSLSNVSLAPTVSNSIPTSHDDDAASDVSDCSERKHDTEGEETDTAPEAEAVNNEDQFDHYGDYVTRCICNFIHDDGYMVECDRCKVWQHVQCVVKNRQIPDEYLCEICDPTKPIDRSKARLSQQQWLRDRQLLDTKIRKENKLKEMFKSKETVSDTESSDGEQRLVHNNNLISKGRGLVGRRKSEGPQKTGKREPGEKPIQRRQKRKERKIVKRRTKAQIKQQQQQQQQLQHQNNSDDENQDTWSTHLPQLRQWIEKYEEAVTNHYSPELRARISSIRVNGAHCDSNIQFDPSVCKCRVHTQPLTELKYLVTTHQLTPNTPVIELRGKYMLSTQHRHGGGSLTTRQHTQRPGPFLFFYRLHKDNTEVCVDTRTYGNSARFIRRSCKPNAELRHCIEKGVLHLYVVSTGNVDKNSELTLKHESHDLAAIGTTQIACACGKPDECSVNKGTVKKNGEVTEVVRKRRGRRTASACLPSPEPVVKTPVKEELPPVPPVEPPPPVLPPKEEKPEVTEPTPPAEVKIEIKEEPLPVIEIKPEVKEEIKEIEVIKEEPKIIEEKPLKTEIKKEKIKEEAKSPIPTPVSTRRSSQYKSDKEETKETKQKEPKEPKSKCKKLSREERKLEAILRAIEQMEKADQRKQEHQAKQAHRRESEPGPTPKEEEKQEPKMRRRRRKGRARTISTNANSSRRCRLNSTDSYMTSGDENMLSPNENAYPSKPSYSESDSDNKAAGLLLALSNDDNVHKREKTPTRELDSNSNSAHSSPEAPQLSSACLLVQAAVEPMEPGFKFPKTKKGLMNEWLNKVPETVQPASAISPSSLLPHISTNVQSIPESEPITPIFYNSPAKGLSALAQAATSFCDNPMQSRTGSAKKRWLRQAISEDHSCESPVSRPESPPLSDMVAPPKKRRLPRESLSNDNSPPTTPTSTVPPIVQKPEPEQPSQEGCVEIVFSGTDGDSPTQTLESDTELKERAAQMKQEYKCVTAAPSAAELSPVITDFKPSSRLLSDPRLSRDRSNHGGLFSNSEHLVGTVEKTLSIFGFENTMSDTITTPTKRKVKLSISEYRQRKKLNTNEKNDEQDMDCEPNAMDDNNSSESFKNSISSIRPRSDSTSSTTSSSSEDDHGIPDVISKAPAFNSEPTELERQREISSMRLKKAFGLPLDDIKKPALDVSTLLSCELEPKVKPIPLPSPTFPIPGTCDIPTRTLSSPSNSQMDFNTERSVSPILTKSSPHLEPMDTEPISSEEELISKDEETVESAKKQQKKNEVGLKHDKLKPHLFYTPDEEEEEEAEEEVTHMETSFEEPESVNYVPPFNNPVYPNSNFASYTSTIDDDARYESRNPSPPPDLGSFNAPT